MCYNCGKEITEKIFRSTTCPSCGKQARVCLNCTFYSPGSQYDCKEHVSEAVSYKDESNFCDYFRYNKNNSSGNKNNQKTETSKKAFDDLFSS